MICKVQICLWAKLEFKIEKNSEGQNLLGEMKVMKAPLKNNVVEAKALTLPGGGGGLVG